jgi:hypothetical protein
MKQFEPPAAPGPNGGIAEGDEEEEWAEAMRLMDAVDGGLNQQIGRTLSLHNSSGMMEHSMGQDQSLTLMSPGLSQYMLLDGSAKEVGEVHEAGCMSNGNRLCSLHEACFATHDAAAAAFHISNRSGAAWSPSPPPFLPAPLQSTLRDEASSVTATTQIVAVARKAQLLRRQQQEIERQVNER